MPAKVLGETQKSWDGWSTQPGALHASGRSCVPMCPTRKGLLHDVPFVKRGEAAETCSLVPGLCTEFKVLDSLR